MAKVFRGVAVSPGVAVGRVVLLLNPAEPEVAALIPPDRVGMEIERFHRAREAARNELRALRDRIHKALGDHYTGILEAQLLIVEDAQLVSRTTQRIEVDRVSAELALRQTIDELTRAFESVDDGYLRERGGDLDDVHRRLQRQLRGGPGLGWASLPDGPLVVVARALGPSDAITLLPGAISGVATDVGGPTSHTAILAQALSVPAVVGLHDLSLHVRPGEPIVVDGDSGRVELLPDDAALAGAWARQEASRARDHAMASDRVLPSVTQDGVDVALRANIEFPEEVERALRYGARGVGLYRSEFLYVSRAPRLPSEDDHYHTYRDIGSQVAPHPAVIRTLDLGGEKYFHTGLERDEANPAMGLRAVRFCLRRPDIFGPQLRGFLRAAAHAELRLLVPLVSHAEEIREVRRLLHREAEALKAAGREVRADVPVGIMIEVPAAAVAADLLAQEADFLSLGTNDLIQYALGVDRGNDAVNYLYQPLHPAVLRMLRFVVHSARTRGIAAALCGEMAADATLTGVLLGLGLRELSVQPRAIGPVRRAIRAIRVAEATEAVEQALQCTSAHAMRARLEGTAWAEPRG